jgi:hypothetical protein
MTKPKTQVHFLPSEYPDRPLFRTGVSLHSHTMHSKEKLALLPQVLKKLPIISQFLEWEQDRHSEEKGRPIDFSRAYWRGPACAKTAYDLEWRQIERMGLRPIVSLTDHDNIDAGLLLQNQVFDSVVPISVEWTIPYGETMFHLGIHNLRGSQAVAVMNEMAAYTSHPKREQLMELLNRFHSDPEMLVVFNHPLWDIGSGGQTSQRRLIGEFLKEFKSQIHAIELNGMRDWRENMGAISLADEAGIAAVSGGDRHGLEPNALLNFTSAMTFAEFISEIREEGRSDIAVMPQYREPMTLRQLVCVWDVVREHPQIENGNLWSERIFVRGFDGIERRLADVWVKDDHQWIDPCLKVVGLLASPRVRGMVRWAFAPNGSPNS